MSSRGVSTSRAMHYGLSQSVSLGVAALFVCVAVVFLARLIARRCCCCWWCCQDNNSHTGKETSHSCGGDGMDTLIVTSLPTPEESAAVRWADGSAADPQPSRKNDASVPLTTGSPVAVYGATLSTGCPAPPHQRLRDGDHAVRVLAPITNSLLTTAADPQPTGGVDAHPYNIPVENSSVLPSTPMRYPSLSSRLYERYEWSVEAGALRQSSLLIETQDADELEEEYRGPIVDTHVEDSMTDDASDAYVVPPPSAVEPTRLQPLSPNRVDNVAKPSLTRQKPQSAPRTRASTPVRQQGVAVTPAGAAHEGHDRHARQRSRVTPNKSTPSPPSSCHRDAPHRRLDLKPMPTTPISARTLTDTDTSGETVTAALAASLSNMHLQHDALIAAEKELRAVLAATEAATAERERLEAEVRDMERYKTTLDGIIAFTLRELEDAADGVAEADAQMKADAAAALRTIAAAQEELRRQSLSA